MAGDEDEVEARLPTLPGWYVEVVCTCFANRREHDACPCFLPAKYLVRTVSLWIADASRRTTCLKICEANFTEAPHYPVLSCPAHHPEASRWCEIAVAPAGSAGQKHFTHSSDTVLACLAELWSREERLALYRRRIEEDTYKVSSCTLALANYRA